jgi:hypothetical protein
MEVNNQNDALNVLVNVAKLAVKRGAFELEETEIILKAIRQFVPAETPKVEETVQETVQKVKNKVKELV